LRWFLLTFANSPTLLGEPRTQGGLRPQPNKVKKQE
jgi:hypothetical protein